MAKRLGDNELQVTATLANDQPGTLYAHLHHDHERIDTLNDALHVLESDGQGDGSATALLLAQLAIELVWVSDFQTLRDLLTRAIGGRRGSPATRMPSSPPCPRFWWFCGRRRTPSCAAPRTPN